MVPPVKKRAVLEKTYNVEEIRNVKYEGEILFEVKWENYPESENTFEPIEHLLDCLVFQNFVEKKFKENESEMEDEIAKRSLEEDDSVKKEEADSVKVDLILKAMWIVKNELKELNNEAFQQEFHESLQKGVYMNKEKIQKAKFQEIVEEIHEKNPNVMLHIENEIDFSLPPSFEFIEKNVVELDSNNNNDEEQTPAVGCKCNDCEIGEKCCYHIAKRRQPYKKNEDGSFVLKVKEPEKLIECSPLCNCSKNQNDTCSQRLTQRDAGHDMILFKTQCRGWGVKANSLIPRNAFVVEYTGEMSKESDANKVDTNFQFLMDTTDRIKRVIDARKKGNLSRFINHSCCPNLKSWIINDCTERPANQRICFFANRKIKKGDELTIDYDEGKVFDEASMTGQDCHCGEEKCKKKYFLQLKK